MKFDQLPFFVGVLDHFNDTPFPLSFPFEVSLDFKLRIYRQKFLKDLGDLLTDVYKKGSMLDGVLDGDEGIYQANAALSFIGDQVGEIEGKEILEIGCGNGYILKKLHANGAKCTGLEPGPQIIDVKTEDIQLINNFFPSPKVTGSYDLIMHFNVLEHIDNPIRSVVEQKKYLKPNGKIIIGVPNAEPYLKSGDISLFVHEHFNYFTKEGLVQLAKQCELSIEWIQEGAGGGMLFVSFIHSKDIDSKNIDFDASGDIKFKSLVTSFHQKLKATILKYGEENVVIYCPLRAINSLFVIGITKCRFVDDKPSIKGKYLPGLENSIESFNDLVDNIPHCIIIFSRTFADKIKDKCLNARLKTEIVTLLDIDKQ